MKFMHQLVLSGSAASLLLLGGCGGSGATAAPPSMTVAQADVDALPTEPRGEVISGGAAVEKAQANLTSANNAIAGVQREVQIANLAIDRAKITIEIVELRFAAAQETKDAEAMLPAQNARKAASKALKAAKENLAYQMALEELRHAQVQQAKTSAESAMAIWESQKFTAVSAADTESPAYFEKKSDFETQKQNAGIRAAESKRSTATIAKKIEAMPKGVVPEPPSAAPAPAPEAEEE